MSRRLAPSAVAPALLITALLVAACGGGEPELSEGTAAQVGDSEVTYAELERSIAQRKAQAEQASQSFPEEGTDGFSAARVEALDALVQQRVVDFEATKCGDPCEVTDEEIDEELARIREENFNDSQEELDMFLEESKITDADARSILKFQLQQPKLFDFITRGVRFTDKQAREYYDENESEFKTPAGRSAAHILVETKEEADALAARVTLENFAELAAENSQDPGSKDNGGDLGQIQRGQLVEPFEKVAFELGDGEISDPVKTQFGWHIITVDTFDEMTTSFASAKTEIKRQQLEIARQDEWNDWRENIVEEWREKTRYAEDALEPPEPGEETDPEAEEVDPTQAEEGEPEVEVEEVPPDGDDE